MPHTLYASIDGRASPLANQEVVFYDPARDQTHAMTAQVLQALDLCRPFRTLDRHIATLSSALTGLSGQEDAIRRVLEGLVARGLLISDESWLDQLGRSGQHEPTEFAGMFIRAGGAPQRLKGLLDSLLAYEQAFAPGHRYVLIDDGDDAHASEHRALLAAFGRAAEVRTHHVGRDVRARLAAALEGMSPGSAAHDLLACRRGGGVAPGAVRNLVSLLTAGRRYLLLDEDMRLPFHRHAEPPRGLDVAARTPVDVVLLPGLDEALADGQPLDDDPLQIHLRLCGASLGDLINRAPGFELRRENLVELEPSRLPYLKAGCRVLATAVGVRGTAAPGPWLFQLDGTAGETFRADRERYLRLVEQPAWRCVPTRMQLRVAGELDALMVDNSTPTPCAPAHGAHAERLYASLWRAMSPSAVSAHVPATLATAATRADPGWLKRPLSPDSHAYLADLVAHTSSEVRASDPWARMGAIAERLRDLAGASDRALRIELREYHAFARSSLIQSMQHAFERAAQTAPVHWQADLRLVIESNGRALIDGGEPRLADAGEADSAEHALRRALNAQAAAMDAWPALWQSARDSAEKLWKLL
ncbi:MAG TPA: hypothetical protein PKZ76_08260 [Xanthomonadaceae bacterium]|nr:hypothetical protein [Xanthomonadaceae bacterium]